MFVGKFKNEGCYYYLLTDVKMRGVTNICWQILNCGMLRIVVDIF